MSAECAVSFSLEPMTTPSSLHVGGPGCQAIPGSRAFCPWASCLISLDLFFVFVFSPLLNKGGESPCFPPHQNTREKFVSYSVV